MMEQIDWGVARFAFDVLQVLFMAGVSVYVWWTGRTKATQAAIDAAHERMGTIDRRLDGIEGEIKHLPGHNDLAEIYRKVNDVDKTLSKLSGELTGINRTLNLINDYLLNQGGKNR
ncbi:MAG: DUF2730 family protein [Pseudomonadales bacterium]|nr:DUF2730 family protein [Pseudomonadales bacterium]